jgi:hypothetical protein
MGPRPYTGRGLKGNDISLVPAFRIPLAPGSVGRTGGVL